MAVGKLIAICISSAALASCGGATLDSVSKSKSASSSAATGLTGGFRPNETLHVYSSSHAGQRRGIIQETGDRYNYGPVAGNIEIVPAESSSNTDASAMLAPKRALVLGGCDKDKMSDKTTCRMNILPQGSDQKGGLYQTVDTNGVLLTSCVIGHDFPGKVASIRVDSNPALTTNDKGCISGEDVRLLERQLLSGKRVITRRVEWPYTDRRDKEMIIDGSFKAALELYKWSSSANLTQLFSMR